MVRRISCRPLTNNTSTTIVILLLISGGCSQGPKAIPPLYINANNASDRALELHDADSNGIIDSDELATAPGLAYAAERADKDGDGGLSGDEITEMVEAWNAKSIGLLTLRANIKLKKRPLAGAIVRLEPAPFLDGQVEAAFGVTDEFGDAFLTIPKEKRPIADSPPGAQFGLYRVVISKQKDGRETVPTQYNAETTLGQEVSFDDPGVLNGIKYTLK